MKLLKVLEVCDKALQDSEILVDYYREENKKLKEENEKLKEENCALTEKRNGSEEGEHE